MRAARSTVTGVLVLAVAAALTTTATTESALAAGATRSPLVLHASTTHVTLSKSLVKPGRVLIRNTGANEIYLASPKNKATAADFARDLNANTETALFRDFVTADVLEPYSTNYLTLSRGNYFLTSAQQKVTTARISTLQVKGPLVNAPVPAARQLAITPTSTLTGLSTAPAGKTLLHVVNGSRSTLAIYRVLVKKAVSAKALHAFLVKPSFDGLDGLINLTSSNPVVLTAALSPGRTLFNQTVLRTGRYLYVVFAESSNEPALHPGQAKLLTVS